MKKLCITLAIGSMSLLAGCAAVSDSASPAKPAFVFGTAQPSASASATGFPPLLSKANNSPATPSGPTLEAAPVEDNSINAWIECQLEMSYHLKAPATAGYPLSYEFPITQKGNKYSMNAWVDAQNGFGAQIRTYFHCTAIDEGDDLWITTVKPLA